MGFPITGSAIGGDYRMRPRAAAACADRSQPLRWRSPKLPATCPETAMLLAPLPDFRPAPRITAPPVRPPRRDDAFDPRWQGWLLGWAGLGLFGCILLALAGAAWRAGGSLPFWLVAAPLIDLAWIGSRALAAGRAGRRRRAQPCSPSRLRCMRRRNSAMMRRYRSSPR
jgi:hypothetical protein